MTTQADNLETILNNLNGTALYVIRQSDRRILYFNDLVKRAIPHIRTGIVCSDAWQKNCDLCPLKHPGKTGSYRITQYNRVFSDIVDITAIPIRWGEEDAYLISLAPHKPSESERKLELERRKLETVTARLYPRAVSINLSRNTYSILHNELDNLSNPAVTGTFDDLFEDALSTMHPDFRDEFAKRFCRDAQLRQHAAGTKEIVMQHRQLLADHRYHWTDTHIILLDNPVNDDVIGIILSRNIDADKREELRQEELDRARQTILHEALKNTSMYEFYYYPRKNLAVLPRRMYEHYGYRERYPDMPYDFAREMIFDEDHANYFQAYRKILRGEKTASTTYRLKDGQTWREVVFSTISEDDNGRPTFVVGLSGDITEHKKAELENIKLQSIYDFTVRRNYDCILIWNVETGTYEARFSDGFDPRNMPLFGRNTQGVRKFAESFVCEEDRPRFLDEILSPSLFARLERERDVHFYFRCPQNGDLRHKELSLCYIGNGHQRILMTLRDIDDMLKKEEQNRQALFEAFEAAKSANEAKSGFLSRMSHDMRTPMNAIIGLTTIAGNHLDDREKIRDCLEKIDTSSRHLLNLINEVLDMSRIESGKFCLEEKPFRLSDLIGDTLDMTRPAILRHKHVLRVDTGDIEHEEIEGDGQRIQEIFLNIVSNAIKYTPEGGTITLTARETPSDIPGIGCYRFVFEDTGIGMSAGFQKKLFEPFEREKDTRTSHVQGTGLGMPIALTIARMMNGNIEVESEIGKGSRFIVTLYLKWRETPGEAIPGRDRAFPEAARGEKPSAASGDIPSSPQFPDKRILLAEDNPLNAEIACELIAMSGAIVETAGNGQAAVDKFASAPAGFYDLVFMDIQMPVMNGYDATQAIRKLPHPDARTVPIVAMTANTFPEDIRQAFQAGMNDHVPKPLDMKQLNGMLRKWLTETATA